MKKYNVMMSNCISITCESSFKCIYTLHTYTQNYNRTQLTIVMMPTFIDLVIVIYNMQYFSALSSLMIYQETIILIRIVDQGESESKPTHPIFSWEKKSVWEMRVVIRERERKCVRTKEIRSYIVLSAIIYTCNIRICYCRDLF